MHPVTRILSLDDFLVPLGGYTRVHPLEPWVENRWELFPRQLKDGKEVILITLAICPTAFD